MLSHGLHLHVWCVEPCCQASLQLLAGRTVARCIQHARVSQDSFPNFSYLIVLFATASGSVQLYQAQLDTLALAKDEAFSKHIVSRG